MTTTSGLAWSSRSTTSSPTAIPVGALGLHSTTPPLFPNSASTGVEKSGFMGTWRQRKPKYRVYTG